jgi:peptide/nickel transport system substrate-binding protein
MSNKMILKIVGVLVAAVMFVSLSGCGTAKTGTGGSTITILIAEDPPSFNAMISDTGYDSLVMELVMLGLTDIDPQGNIFPELAAELPTVENGSVKVDENAGTMEVTWKMRNDIQWADGIPVTADDVVFTWNAIQDPETGSWIPGIDYVDSLEKVDDYTFMIKYNTIYPGYLTQLGGEQLVIWPAHYCNPEQGFSSWDCGRNPLSNGPYILKEWITGDHLDFSRNPQYYQKGKPAIDNISVRIVPDNTVRKTMMINGDADIDMWVTEQVIADLKNSGKVGVSLSPFNRWVVRLFMNEAANGTVDPISSPHPVLSDVRVRQAIRMAIDVDTISKQIFYGYGIPVWNEFFRPPYACDIPRPKFDLEAAKALLEQAGWKDANADGVRECQGCLNAPEGYRMEMEFITYAEFGEPMTLTQQFIAEALGKIGMKLNLSVIQGSVLWADSNSGGIEQTGNFDIDLWDDGYGGVDPTDFITELYGNESAIPDFGWNIARWQNDEFNNLLNEIYTLDESHRKETFCRMAQILDEQVPVILMFSAVNADAYSLRLQGVQSSTNDLVTWNVADWQIVK